MDDLTPVKGPSNPFEGRSAKVMALVIVFLLVALIKPWGNGEPTAVLPPGFSSGPPATAVPVAVAASPTPFDPFANYDHEIFGVYEPEPRWELWPAGYLVSFGYAIRIESTPSGAPSSVSTGVTTPVATTIPSLASGAPSSAPSTPAASASAPAASGVPAASASAAPVGDEPIWPATIRITHGNELAMIGVNMPLGYRVTGIGITRTSGGADESLPVVTPASDWPSHFTVISLADANGVAVDHWPPGTYRLELAFEPDHIVRSIDVEIEAPTPDEPTSTGEPAPSSSPGPS